MASLAEHICSSCLRRTIRQQKTLPTRFPRRSLHQSAAVAAFAPPSPASLGKAAPAKEYKRLRKWGRRFAYLTLVGAAGYVVDNQFYAASITRSVRTFSLGLLVALDYKINFRENPPFAADIAELHHRNASKLFDLLRTNGGLYLKNRTGHCHAERHPTA